jgi:uncharacterized repeat protein (TIGR03803 family)
VVFLALDDFTVFRRGLPQANRFDTYPIETGVECRSGADLASVISDLSWGYPSMTRNFPFAIRLLAISAVIVVFAVDGFAAGQTAKVLYRFAGGSDGSDPEAGLVADHNGNLYGTTSTGGDGACSGGCGTVFELTPNPDGGWTETRLYTFTGSNDGAFPGTGVIFDRAGNLYGTTIHGGASGDGVVFRLSPTTQGDPWTQTVLYNFDGDRDGYYCFGGLVFDAVGNLYGAGFFGGPTGNGTIFQLVPPVQGAAWSLNVLHVFKGTTDGLDPYGALILDKQSSLYGTTHDGKVFRLKPPSSGQTTRTLQVLYTASDQIDVGSLLFGKDGVLFGTTGLGGPAHRGKVFQLTPPAAGGRKWTATTIYQFSGQTDGEFALNGLIADRSGNLYGATQSGGTSNTGTVFKLSPPATPGGTWTETILHSFSGGSDGADPGAGLIFGRQGALYGTTQGGGTSNNGTVFKIGP